MRTEQEMFDLILNVAKNDPRIRGVYMNGSRANPNVPKDVYQDYDIVYVVNDFSTFMENQSWIDIFGERLLLQMPEAMRYPSGEGHFSWMMLFTDGNRLDLTLIPIDKLELIGNDSLTITLLDKDGVLPGFSRSSDKDYLIELPSQLFYLSCCNNFWWCMQNVAKGIARNELPYAMMMYHNVIRIELHDMISWYIGIHTNFGVSAGKMGKFFQKYLPSDIYKRYLLTYSDSNCNNMWKAVFVACDLFSCLALEVADYIGYSYDKQEEDNMREYLKDVKNSVYEAAGTEKTQEMNEGYCYKKATLEDLDELVRTRVIVLRGVLQLPEDVDMSQVQQASYEYYQSAMEKDDYITYLVYDNNKFIGAGGISFYQVAPTYNNPSGKKAYIMNMYTDTEYRRKGIATKMLDFLVKAAKEKGVTYISLEATEMGRPLYENYGFVEMDSEMILQ